MESSVDTETSPGAKRGSAGAPPLQGLKVIDLTSVLMGPYASQILGDMGADVIKIESPDGDSTRQIGPSRNPGMGGMYLNTNRSKRSLCLDLKTEAGKHVLMRLIVGADVFLYNVRPQAMGRLGLSYKALQAVNPRLIYVGVFGFGQDGPYAAKPAYDDLLQGASTLAALFTRSTGKAPHYVPLALVDRIAGLTAVSAILAALFERASSGEGQSIDVPMFETMTNFVLSDHMGGLSFVPPLDGGGYRRLLSISRRPYKTRDGYICAVIYTDKQWNNFYKMLGREAELKSDARLLSLTTRTQHIDEIYGEIEVILAQRTTAEWIDAFEKFDIPTMPVHDLESIFSDPHLKAINYFETEEHPSEGTLRTMRNATTWSRTQPRSTLPAPRHGEHNHEILEEFGFGPAEIAALEQAGVVQSLSKEP